MITHLRAVEYCASKLDVLLADMPEFLNFSELSSSIYEKSKHHLQTSDALFIRLSVGHSMSGISLDDVAPVLLRARRMPVHFIWSDDYQYRIGENVNPNAEAVIGKLPGQGAFWSSLCQNELLQVVNSSKALISCPGKFHFETPAGDVDSFFLRVGNIQGTRENVDAVFFWLIPFMRGVGAVLTDTWSISSIALNSIRLLRRYDETSSKRIRFEMLPHYLRDSEIRSAYISQVFRRLLEGHDDKVLFIESACKTNRLVRNLKESIEHFGHDPDRFSFVSLFDIRGEAEIPCLCDLTKTSLAGVFKKPERRGGRSVIPIDPDVYFPLQMTERHVGVRTSVTKQSRRLFRLFPNAGVFRVHSDYTDRGSYERHHAIDVDVRRMLEQEHVRRRLERELLRRDPLPTLLVTPSHRTGQFLGRFAQEAFGRAGHRVEHFVHDTLFLEDRKDRELSEEESRLREVLSRASWRESMIILDDVSISGDTLVGYQKNLFSLFRGRITYMVVVARPDDWGAWEHRVKMLRYRASRWGRRYKKQNSVVALFRVVLPDWDKADCPWCEELSYYKRRNLDLEYDDIPEEVFERMAWLTSGSEGGIVGDVFPRGAQDYSFGVGRQSIFVDEGASEAVVFSAVAGAIQRLRDRDRRDSLAPGQYPIAPVLPWTEHLKEVFMDSALRSSILRATSRAEIEPIEPESDRRRRRAIKRLLLKRSGNENNITWELLLQMALDKIPSIELTDEERGILIRRGHGKIYRYFCGDGDGS